MGVKPGSQGAPAFVTLRFISSGALSLTPDREAGRTTDFQIGPEHTDRLLLLRSDCILQMIASSLDFIHSRCITQRFCQLLQHTLLEFLYVLLTIQDARIQRHPEFSSHGS